MADPTNPSTGEDVKTTPNEQPAAQTNTGAEAPQNKGDDAKKEEGMISISQSKWDQMYARMKKSEEIAEQFQKQREEEEEKRLLQDKNYDEVINRLKTENQSYKDRASQVDQMEQTLAKLLEAEMQNISPERLSLIPETFTVQQKLDYIASNRSLLVTTSQPAKPSTGSDLPKNNDSTPLEEIDQAKARLEELKEKKLKFNFFTSAEQKEWMLLTRKIAQAKKDS